MAFVEPITIKEAIDRINKKEFLIPAIQREFVWKTHQIERLFDSLMRDYPISSFLFWEVDKSNINNYQFYEFVRDYHEKNSTHNPKANIDGESGIIAILDGQQRLTSLYIGLRGSYAYRLRYKRWDNDSAFPKRKLCLNLLAPSNDGDLKYDFQFLTKKESKQNDGFHFWFVVGDVLKLAEPYKVNEYLINNNITRLEKEKANFANETLYKLHQVIHLNKPISSFLEKDDSLDKVLNVFIRVNSGGTQLSYSDLLLSIATAQWDDKDAREEITGFVDEINSIGNGFNVNKDFVLKNCLVLSGLRDIAFKVDNFNRENMLTIEKKWEGITKAIKSAIVLVSSFGYHRDTLVSNNALIPIGFYLHKIGSPDNFSESKSFKNDRKKIFKWLIIVLLKRTFSGQPDNVLRPIREVINASENGFPLGGIIEKLKGGTKAISFNKDEIDNLLHYQYAEAYTYSVLAFIYPSLDFRNKFHQDHIFPRRLFTEKKLRGHEINDDDIEFYLDNFNCLANLQLLEGIQNQEKSGKEFNIWINEAYPKEADRKTYMEKHYIPDIDLSLVNFREFIKEREKLIVSAFKKLLE